mmetsp:Transcript_104056/g.333579  ORF Transcript_104056/g.333579 Transcript_104056/m.333579 type:complete len:589 (-) Transcript_104056:53-1819(-)
MACHLPRPQAAEFHRSNLPSPMVPETAAAYGAPAASRLAAGWSAISVGVGGGSRTVPSTLGLGPPAASQQVRSDFVSTSCLSPPSPSKSRTSRPVEPAREAYRVPGHSSPRASAVFATRALRRARSPLGIGLDEASGLAPAVVASDGGCLGCGSRLCSGGCTARAGGHGLRIGGGGAASLLYPEAFCREPSPLAARVTRSTSRALGGLGAPAATFASSAAAAAPLTGRPRVPSPVRAAPEDRSPLLPQALAGPGPLGSGGHLREMSPGAPVVRPGACVGPAGLPSPTARRSARSVPMNSASSSWVPLSPQSPCRGSLGSNAYGGLAGSGVSAPAGREPTYEDGEAAARLRTRIAAQSTSGIAMSGAPLAGMVEVELEPAMPKPNVRSLLRIYVPATATMRQVKEAVARRMAVEPALVQLISGTRTNSDGTGQRFTSFEDTERLGDRRRLGVLGVDLPAAPAASAVAAAAVAASGSPAAAAESAFVHGDVWRRRALGGGGASSDAVTPPVGSAPKSASAPAMAAVQLAPAPAALGQPPAAAAATAAAAAGSGRRAAGGGGRTRGCRGLVHAGDAVLCRSPRRRRRRRRR